MIQMMQGHALTILSGMPRDALFDAVITDPPYASGAATQNGISAKTSTKYTSSKNCPYPDFEGDAMDKRICVPGGCILDPFMGSGTTLLAADLEGYDAIGFELHEAIFRSAQERIKERT